MVNLRDQLVEELQLLHLLRPGTAPPSEALADPLRAERSARIASVLMADKPVVSGTIFLCSDLARLPGAMVALSSVLRHNRASLRNCRFCVFLSEDAMPLAALVQQLAAAQGLAIKKRSLFPSLVGGKPAPVSIPASLPVLANWLT